MNELRDELIDRKRLADDQKEIGNKHFKSGHIEESIKCYTNAIQLYESNPVFYCNRSMAYLKKGLPLEAHRDCDLALNIDNTCIKALYRRGLSRRQLFRYSLALDDFRRVLTLDADNSDAKRELAATQRLIQSKAIVEIKAIDKPLELQSKTPLTKVAICCDKKSCEFVVQLPESVPKTYYQFECDWRQLIGPNSQQLRLNYLQMIGREDIQRVLTSTLEPQMISDLLNTICHSNDCQLIYNVLHQMSETPRFDTIVFLLSKSDHLNLNKIIENLKLNHFNENLISEIKNSFL